MTAIAPLRGTVALIVAYAFCNAAAYIASRAVADSLFLSHIGPGQLPRMFVITAIAVTLTATIHARAASRLRIHAIILATLSLWAITYACLPMLALRWPKSLLIFGGVILLSEIRGALGTIHLATLIHEHFAQAQSQRVVGIVGLGSTLGGLSIGMLVAMLSDTIEGEQMLYLSAIFDVLAILLVSSMWLYRMITPGMPVDTQSAVLPEVSVTLRFRDAFASLYVRGMAVAVMAAVAVSLLVEYRWKYTIASVYYRDEHNLTEYFGFFYAAMYLVTGLIQLLVTGRLLERFGPFPGLFAFPLGLLVAVSVTLGADGAFLLTTEMSLTKGCDALRRGLYDPAIQVLYARLPEVLRRQAIALVAGVAKPLAEGVTSLALLLAPTLNDDTMLGVTLIFLMIWIFILMRFHRLATR
jgi:AAA family ATP:ADP antiporter